MGRKIIMIVKPELFYRKHCVKMFSLLRFNVNQIASKKLNAVCVTV